MTILIFLAVLVVLILVHEFGHFIVAKKSGIRVDEFGIGFPPKAWGRKFGETEYTLNWLPIGGFVRIWGEDPTQEVLEGPDQERSFVNKPKLVQAAVLVAGVAMNVLLAFVLYAAANMIGSPTEVDETDTEHLADASLYVTSVAPGTPADEVLAGNDRILAARTEESTLAGNGPVLPSELRTFIMESNGAVVMLDIERRGEELTVSVMPEQGVIAEDPERYAAGFTMALVGLESMPIHIAIYEAGKQTWNTLVAIVVGLGTLIGQIFTGSADFSQVAGPVGIVEFVGDAAALGISWLLTFTAFISLNLAVINLLPIPALDGGRLLFVGIEAITRRPITPSIATRINQVGFVFLLSLMALVTVHDVLKFF